MEIEVNEAFKAICRMILAENLTEEEWAAFESDDMFQNMNYEGGFDATEGAFCFSFFDDEGKEYWLQVTLEEINQILKGDKVKVQVRPAE